MALGICWVSAEEEHEVSLSNQRCRLALRKRTKVGVRPHGDGGDHQFDWAAASISLGIPEEGMSLEAAEEAVAQGAGVSF